jgi:hypothetical protein
MQEKHYLVPHHSEGAAKDIFHQIGVETIEDSEDYFVDAKDRLLDVTNWAKYGGIESSAHFKLADSHGQIVTRHARRTDHILICSIEAGQEAELYDWFTINALEYDDYPDSNLETFAIRLMPTVDPAAAAVEGAGQLPDTATIVVERNGVQLRATYHGRNVTDVETTVWSGLTEAHWLSLMVGLLEYF